MFDRMYRRSYRWYFRNKIHQILFCPFSSVAIERNSVKILTKYLNVSKNQAEFLILKQPVINKLDDSRVKELITTLKELGFEKQELINHPLLFSILPITVRFRYRVLEECGISDLSPDQIVSYLPIIKQKSIGDLKNSLNISRHLNVENKLASYMTQWPTSLTTLIYEDVEKLTLYALRLKIIQRYLELVLDLSKDEFERGLKTYPTIKHRPLECINEALSLLQSQIMLPSNKIKSNLYLVHMDPDNLKSILYKFRSIGGIDIKEIIRLYPRIATKSYKSLVETRKILEEFGISNEAQRRCFDVYTLGPSTVRERLKNAMETPEFIPFIDHPRFLKVIHYNNTALKRLKILYDNNKKCWSLNILSGSSEDYETFEKAPGDRLGKGKDLIFCISQSFGGVYTVSDIRKIIKRHPFWINIPVVQVKYVYQKLITIFSTQEIYENCPVLLYPWDKIKKVLSSYNIKSQMNNQNMPYEHFDIAKISNSQKLSLVLYQLEKNHYFSGNGVWSDDHNKKK